MLRVGIIGFGGFARTHHKTACELEKQDFCKVICGCDPEPDAFADQMAEWEFEKRGVRVYDHYLKMLDAHSRELDVVTIPTPVPLHAEMHRACVERGVAVYLEKPPTVNYAELDEMLAVESKAKKLTNVGFNFIVEEPRQELKKRILSGEFGRVRESQFSGMWPRATSYFQRADWAGRLMMDGRLVLDSCMSNATAHYIHNTLFWCGEGELLSWARVRETQAELYRAHGIEGFDTVFADAVTETGVRVRIANSHAVAGHARHYEKVICDKAVITYVCGGDYRVEWADGRVETGQTDRRTLVVENFRHYFSYVGGNAGRPLTRLVDSRPFVEFCDLVYIASGAITTVPDSRVEREGQAVAIRGLRDIGERFLQSGEFPSAQGLGWTRPAGTASVTDLPKLRSTVEGML